MIFREFIRQNPFFRLLLPLIIGIVVAHAFSLPQMLNYSFVLVGLLGVMIFTFVAKLRKSYALRSLFGVFVFFTCIGAGGIRYFDDESSMQMNFDNSSVGLLGNIVEQPVEKANSYAVVFKVKQQNKGNDWQNEGSKMMLYLQKDKQVRSLQMGDQLLLNSSIRQVKNLGNPYEFDYASYLKTQHILYTSYVDSLSWNRVGKNTDFSFRVIAAQWRDNLLEIYRKNGIKGESFDILAALTLGYKTSLDPDTKKAWANAGAMHVLAVSGLHVGIIYLIMSFLLRFLTKLKYGSLLRGFVLLITLWLYAFLTGLSPSVMRSASMFSFIVIGEMLKRNGSVYNSLAVSAFFLLLIDPFLLFTVGFQFSYLAVVGIVFFQPKIDKLLQVKNVILKKLWQLTSVSLAAQVGTFPLAIYYFHQFPSYFLISGYIVILMAGVLIYLSAILLILSPIEILSKYLGWLLQNVVEMMNYLIIKIQNWPGSVVKNLSMNSMELVLIYGLILSLISLLVFKKRKAIYTFLMLVICLQIPSTYALFKEGEAELIVFNSQRNSIIGMINDKKATFLIDAELPKDKKDRIIGPYILGKGIVDVKYEELKPVDIRLIGGKVIVIIGKKVESIDKIVSSLNPDFIIYRKSGLKTKNILTKKQPNCQVIFDASLYSKDRRKFLIDQNIDKNDIIDIQTYGACVCQL